MTTSPIKRRRTAQQILLRRACQTKGNTKSQDAVLFSGRNRSGDKKGGILVLPSMARDFGLIQERSLSRSTGKVRRVPAPNTFRISGERRTAGKLSGCDDLPSDKKLKPNGSIRNHSGQRSGYTSRGSTKSQNSSSTYPSKWPISLSTEDAFVTNSKGSLNEINNCPPLDRTPYDHNLSAPLKTADSSQCPPIKKKARRKNLKAAAAVLSGAQPLAAKPPKKSRNQSSGDRTASTRGSSQSSGRKLETRAYSGEEVRQFHCPYVTYKNYRDYSGSETEFDTPAESNPNRHSRTESFYKKIDKVSRPPSMCVNTGVWSLELPSETEMQEFLGKVDESPCPNMNQSSYSAESYERKLRTDRGPYQCNSNKIRRDGDRTLCYCNCASKGHRCSMEDGGCPCTRSNPEACLSQSRNSVRFINNEWCENDYECHEPLREELYHKKRPYDDYGYIHKQSNGFETGHGTGWTRRERPSCSHRSRPSRPGYTMGAYRGSYGTEKYGRGPCEMEYECKANEAISNRKCTEAITQTSKIIMTKRIDENSANCSANCSFDQAQCCLEENRFNSLSNSLNQNVNMASPNRFNEVKCICDEFGETELNGAELTELATVKSSFSKQDKLKSAQSSKNMDSWVVKSNSLMSSDQKQIGSQRTNSMESRLLCNQGLTNSCTPCQMQLPQSCSPCQQELSPSNLCRSSSPCQGLLTSCSPCKQGLPSSCSPCQQGSPPSGLTPQQCSADSYQQPNCHQYNKTLLDQVTKECPSVTTSLCECSQEETRACKRITRNPRKRVRKTSRCRDRSGSHRKDPYSWKDCSGNQRRSLSYENYNRRSDQMEDQCDVIRILSIIQQTVAGLQKEIKKGKGHESSRSSGNGIEQKGKKRAGQIQVTNLAREPRSSSPCQKKISHTSLPVQKNMSRRSLSGQNKLSDTSLVRCQKELSQPCSPCQQGLPACSPHCQPELTPLSAPCQQEMPSLCTPCQPALSPMSAPCQQEFSPCSKPCQQEFSPCSNPCQQELRPPNVPCKQGLSQSIPGCQQRSSPSNPPCTQGWSLYQPHMEWKHHHGCRYSNRYSHSNNGTVPVNFVRPIHTNNPFTYGLNPNNIYQERRAPPLAYWNQVNQGNVNIFRNAADIGMTRGCTRTEPNYPALINERNPQMSPYNDPTYSKAFKNKRSINDPEVQCMKYPNRDWYRNSNRTNVCPGNHLARTQLVDPRCGKCQDQDPSNRCRVTFQKHVSSRSNRAQSHQTEAGFQYGNKQCYYEEAKAGLVNINHKPTCKGSQNPDNLRKELYQYQESLPAHEINTTCAQSVQRNILDNDLEVCENPNCTDRLPRKRQDIDLDICENPNCSDRFLRNIKEIDSESCENPSCPFKFPRNRDDIDTPNCDDPNCPYRFERNRIEIDSEVCESQNSSYTFSRNIETIDSEDCENPNCPYRNYRNREAIDSPACENPNCPYRFRRNREDINTEVCENPNCPYQFSRNREAIDSLVCENPNCPYKFSRNRKTIDSVVCDNPNTPYRSSRNREAISLEVCESPNCPYKFPRNRDDIDTAVCENPNCPYRFKKNRIEIDTEVCANPNCPYKLPRNRDDINTAVCENPNCPYRFQRNRLETDSDVCESPNFSDRLKRVPNKPIICNNPQCPDENPQSRCDDSSSMESCENHHLHHGNKNNMWLSGGLEPVESNLIPSQPYYAEHKSEDNRFKEDSCHIELPRRQRVLFSDLTNKGTRQNSGKSERFDDDSSETKSSSKNGHHKTQTNIPSGMRPTNRTGKRLSPYLMPDPLNSYDKHILKNCEKYKIEKCKTRESVTYYVRRPENQTPLSENKKKRKREEKKIFYSPPKSYKYDECSSTSSLSACSCSKQSPQKKTNRQGNFIYPEDIKKERRKNDERTTSKTSVFSCSKKEKASPPKRSEERCKNGERTTSKTSVFLCMKTEEKTPLPKSSEKRFRNYERTTSKTSVFSCSKKEKAPPPKRSEKRFRNYERTTSKTSVFSCSKKEKAPPPRRSEDNCKTNNLKKENRRNAEKSTSKASLLSCVKRKEKPPAQNREKRKNLEKTTSKSSELSCFNKKKQQPPPKCEENNGIKGRRRNGEKENYLLSQKTKSKSSGVNCLKKNEKPSSLRCENDCKKGQKNFEIENNSKKELNKSKSKKCLCFNKNQNNTSFQSANNGRKERCRNTEKENELRSEKNKSKSSGLNCCKKKEKCPSLQCENSGRKEKRRSDQKENYLQGERTKSKLSVCFMKQEKSTSWEGERYGKKERYKYYGKEIDEDERLREKFSSREDENYGKSDRRRCVEKRKSKLSGLFSCLKKKKPEEDFCKSERCKYYEYELPEEGEKRPSWLSKYQCCQRDCRKKEKKPIEIWEDTLQNKEKPMKRLELPACCYRKPKTSDRIEECPYSGSDDDELTVLYDSSYRFNQKSCSGIEITINTYCYTQEEDQGTSACSGTAKKQRQSEYANGFYKIGQ